MLGLNFRKALALSAAAGSAVALSVTGAPAFASGAPVTQTTTYTVNAASETPVDVGTINSQFTSITLTAAGTAWFADGAYTTPNSDWFLCGAATANPDLCPAPDAPVGELLYRVGTSGPWLPAGTGPVNVTSDSVQDVYVLYNDVSGTYAKDNGGSYTVTATRTKP